MRTTTALLAVLLLAAGTAGCSGEKSYEEITADCVAALKDRAEGDKAKPAACGDVKEDDYQTLLMSHILQETGLVKDGKPARDGLLEDASQP